METRTGGAARGATRAAGTPAGTTATDEAARACHDVLLAMAGRVPDRTLWRLRDWLASGAVTALRTALPRTLVRHRVGVTDAERALLRAAVLGWSGSGRLVDAVPHLDAVPAPAATFSADGPRPGWDATDLALRALVPATGVRELRRAWRRDGADRGGVPCRVVVVRVGEDGPDPAVLAGSSQRGLRALGETDPRVEVLSPSSPATGYHEAATVAAELLWGSEGETGAVPPRRAGATGELVSHG